MTTKFRFNLFVVITLIAIAFLAPQRVQASMTSIGLTGFVTEIDGLNPFGITHTSLVSGNATFDETRVDPFGVSYDWNDPSMSFVFHLGSFSFNSLTDFFLGLTFGFVDNSLTNIALSLGTVADDWGLEIVWDDPGAANVFSIYHPELLLPVVTGELAPVPVPTTILLLGSGLALLLGFKRKPKSGRRISFS
jgi:hypothetical protein